MLNNPWPSMIWHLFDYFFEPTSSYFAVKLANEELHAQVSFKDYHVYVVNSGYDISPTLRATLWYYSVKGELLHKEQS